MSCMEPGRTPRLAWYAARTRRMTSSSARLQSRDGLLSCSTEDGTATLRGRLGRGSMKEGTMERRGGSMGRELRGLMAASSPRDWRGGGSGDVLSSLAESASEAALPDTEAASGERERGLGFLGVCDGDAAVPAFRSPGSHRSPHRHTNSMDIERKFVLNPRLNGKGILTYLFLCSNISDPSIPSAGLGSTGGRSTVLHHLMLQCCHRFDLSKNFGTASAPCLRLRGPQGR
jgi:hypothetical protein